MQFVEFPALYKKSSTSALLVWHISVSDNKILTSHGKLDGAMQDSVDEVKEGKSAGKKNATTAEQQALFEAKSRWTKKQKLRYVTTPEAALNGVVDKALVQGGIPPMLCINKSHPSDPILSKYLKYPCIEQPKLDGVCCIAILDQGKATLWSRTQKLITSMPHIVEALEELAAKKPDLGYTVFHGELYTHTYHDRFEDLISIIRKDEPDQEGLHKLVQLHVYDLPQCDLYHIDYDNEYLSRYDAYHSILGPRFPENPLQPVLGNICHNLKELLSCYESRLVAGYEGSMAKNLHGKYASGKRSSDLLKMKEFSEGEMTIVEVLEGRGKNAGTCSTIRGLFTGADGKQVLVDPPVTCSYDKKLEYWKNKEMLVGKKASIKFKRLSADGVPYIPSVIWKAVRDYE